MLTTLFCPPITWAQRKDVVYVTISVPVESCKNITVKYDTDDVLEFSADGESKTYKCQLKLSHKFIPAESKHCINRNVFIMLKKAEEVWWDTFTETRNAMVKVDWDRWVDEDETPENDANDWSNMGGMGGMEGLGGMGMGGMGGMGMGGMGGMEGMDMGGLGGMGMGGGMPNFDLGEMGDMGDGEDSDLSDLEDGEGDADAPKAEAATGAADTPAAEAVKADA